MTDLYREIAKAAAWDAGNRSMRAAGRTFWNRDDYNVAVRELHRLDPCPPSYHCPLCKP